MQLAEIVRKLERWRGRFEREAVRAAVEQREEITPELLRMLEETVERAAELAPQGDWIGHLYAMCLVAQFREVRAYPLVVRFGRLPRELLRSLCGDFLTEDYANVLASVSGGDVSAIQSLIEDESVDVRVRSVAFDSLSVLVAEGQRSRVEIVDYLRRLFRGGLERRRSPVWASLVCCSCDLYPEELLPDIEQAFRDGLIDPTEVGMDSVLGDLAEGKERMLARLRNDCRFRMIDDAAAYMEKWYRDDVRTAASVKWSPALVTSPVRSTPKVGRNDPCPCESGKKYKKCCGG